MMSFLRLLFMWVLITSATEGEETLRSTAELRSIAANRLAERLPVKISGVVTSVRGKEYPEFTIQDAKGGLIAHLEGPVGDRVVAGQQVEIEGVTDARPPSPRVTVSVLRAGEVVGMPPPVKVNPMELKDGSKDCSYIEFTGVIRKVEIEESVPPVRLVLDFGPSGRGLSVWVSHFDEAEKARLKPDAEVVVRGVCNSWRSPSFQPFNTFVTVADPGRIDLRRAAPDAVEAIPERRLEDLLMMPVNDFGMHRERASGIVTLRWPDGQIVLQDGPHAIRTFAGNLVDVRLGEKLEAVGFPSRRDGMVVLEDAEYVDGEMAALVEPEELLPERVLRESGRVDREGRLLRIPGTFQKSELRGGYLVLGVLSGKRKFEALLPPDEKLPPSLIPGSHLVLTGVCRMTFTEHSKRMGRYPDQFQLQLQDSRAIYMAGEESWWTLPRVLLVIVPLAAALLGWVMVLRRRVRKRGQLLVKEIRARHDAELLAAERMRLAGDLHDTLSQSLSGAAMQLEVAGNLAADGLDADDHLALAKILLDRSREDLRRTVWDLGPSALAGQDLATALENIARESAGHRRVVVRREGELSSIPERIRVHLFRAGQEALNNALRHGNPDEVGIQVHVGPGEVLLVITDDGRGFDPEGAPGPEEGHFGLRSLRERIARLGGELEIASFSGGTKITAKVPFSP